MSFLGTESAVVDPKNPYTAENGQVSATYHPAASQRVLPLGMSTATFAAPGSATNGEYGLFRWTMKPWAGGPGPHFHRTFSEAFYVLSGSVQLRSGDDNIDTRPGDFLYVPPGGIHGFANVTDQPAEMLILFSPGPPRERYFEELAEVAERGLTLSEEEWIDLFARHDQFLAT